MILYNNIVEISKNRWIGYMLKVAFLLASSIHVYNPKAGSGQPLESISFINHKDSVICKVLPFK